LYDRRARGLPAAPDVKTRGEQEAAVQRVAFPGRERVALTADQKTGFMAEALVESRKALPACRPNPPVGCVIVGGGRIVARGFTGPPGDPHAEAAAISSLVVPNDGGDLAAFVTLEPCAFTGRTPSCAKALVERGIGTVLVGIIDPDPRNSGSGLQLLRDAGVTVELGILEDQIRAFLGPYLIAP
jgi:pyrimidine deaminase RibD-like protein